MMMKKEQTAQLSFLDTYARVMLSDWQTLMKFIQEHTKRLQQQLQSDPRQTNLNILSEQQIQEIMHGPYHHFVQQQIHAFALLNFANYSLKVDEDEAFKAAKMPQEITKKTIPAKMLQAISQQDIDRIRTELERHFYEAEEQWETLRQESISNLNAQFLKNNLALSEDEKQTLAADEPISELLERFTERQLILPKHKSKQYTFADYYFLKCIIVVHSALSRQQLPHTKKEIDTQLKTFKTCFNQIKLAEQTCIENQKTKLSEIMAVISFVSNYI